MSRSHDEEQKTFIKTTYTNNVQTRERRLCCWHFLRFVGGFF